jgi:hypothetical protein
MSVKSAERPGTAVALQEHPMGRKRALVDAVIVAATIAVLPASVAGLWACGWYARPEEPAVIEPRGTIEGRVVAVDFQTLTIQLSPTRFGFTTIPIVATADTRVVVGDKEGALRDMYAESWWRIAYERRDADLVAVCAQFMDLRAEHAESPCRTSPQADVVSLDAAPRADVP